MLKKRGKIMQILFVLGIGVVMLSSCTEFFTSSWGEGAKRDPSKVKVTSSNAAALVRAARGDPELSRTILAKIAGMGGGGWSPALQVTAVRAANQGSGISKLILENVGLIAKDTTKTTVEDLLDTIKASAKGNHVDEISGELKIVLDSALSNNAFSSDFLASVNESDLVLLFATLVIADMGDDTMEDYSDGWSGAPTAGMGIRNFIWAAAQGLRGSDTFGGPINEILGEII
ncbi:MAG: hypothetical protein LBS64_00760 [Spirochaetaceae bacterium]|jgi:hypothetical protein|nr:hypothetical protein [Spirochaetaceae bacterium]